MQGLFLGELVPLFPQRTLAAEAQMTTPCQADPTREHVASGAPKGTAAMFALFR